MKRILFITLFAILCAAPSFAQDDYNKVEGYVGYSHNRVDVGTDNQDPEVDDVFDEREGFNGVNASITGNFHRYAGIKFDYSFHTKNFESGTDNTNFRLHNFLGGVQFKDNTRDESKAIKPFAHFLIGASTASVDLTEFDETLSDFNETGLAGVIGGGLDIRVHPRIDIRAIQFDYNPTRFDTQSFAGSGSLTNESQTFHNFRIGVGIVFH